jgi:hypothetical protein
MIAEFYKVLLTLYYISHLSCQRQLTTKWKLGLRTPIKLFIRSGPCSKSLFKGWLSKGAPQSKTTRICSVFLEWWTSKCGRYHTVLGRVLFFWYIGCMPTIQTVYSFLTVSFRSNFLLSDKRHLTHCSLLLGRLTLSVALPNFHFHSDVSEYREYH